MRPTLSVAAGSVAAGLASATDPASARSLDRPPRIEPGTEFGRPPPPEWPRAPGLFGPGAPRVHPVPHPGPGRPGFGRETLLLLVGAAGRLLPRVRSRVGGRPMASVARPTGLTPADYRAYEEVLSEVHAACNAQDLDALGRLATPDMAERLADRFAADVYNLVTDVRLRRMDPVRVWSENGFDHATIALRYSMTDVVCDGYGRVLHGVSPGRVTVRESWTYVRHGRWLLDAIQRGDEERNRDPRGTSPAGRSPRSAR